LSCAPRATAGLILTEVRARSYDQAVDRYSFARRGGRAKGTSVRARSSPTERYQITLNQLILDGEVEIGKGPQKGRIRSYSISESTGMFGAPGCGCNLQRDADDTRAVEGGQDSCPSLSNIDRGENV
jgi:hypothetical protein